MHHTLYLCKNIGDCITSAAAGSVCGLNSVASDCSGLSDAANCSCNSGYETLDGINCTGKAELALYVIRRRNQAIIINIQSCHG